jgi:hypothetical protein
MNVRDVVGASGKCKVYRNKQNWIDRKYRKAYCNNKEWDIPHKCLRRRH